MNVISFSGIDCAGKSTQIEKVDAYLKEKKQKCVIIHSRGGYTPLLELIKSIIRPDKKCTPQEKQHYREAVHSNPQKRKLLLWLSIFDLGLYYGIWFRIVELFGTRILADRYFGDSYIDFQMKYPELDFESWSVWKLAVKLALRPEISVIYTIPAELSMYRSTLKDEPWPEPIEIRKERIARYEKEIAKGRWQLIIDASGSIQEVFCETVKQLFHDTAATDGIAL